MRDNHVGCLVVLGEDEAIAGIVTERDVLAWASEETPGKTSARVEEIMTREVITCPAGTSISEIQRLMVHHQIRHVPLVQEGRAVGMVSGRDVMKHQLNLSKATKGVAEQVAMMSKLLKHLDFDDVAELATNEVPRIFGARRSALCLRKQASPVGDSALLRWNYCPCPENTLQRRLKGFIGATEGSEYLQAVPECCRELGCSGLCAVIPIAAADVSADGSSTISEELGFLCMCGIDESDAQGPRAGELFYYKASLIQDILSVNISNARLSVAARRGAMDALTGLPTRRFFDAALAREYRRALRYKQPFCLAMIDLDNFKSINDTFGHAEGDRVLRALASVMRKEVRSPDVLARYGGDEFVLLLPQTQPEDGRSIVKRMQKAARTVPLMNGAQLSFSCGIAGWTGDPEQTPSDILKQADQALYEAKQTGRGRVVLAGDEAAVTS